MCTINAAGYSTIARRSTKDRRCDSCSQPIARGDRYLAHVASPRTELGNGHWSRLVECADCARCFGRGELVDNIPPRKPRTEHVDVDELAVEHALAGHPMRLNRYERRELCRRLTDTGATAAAVAERLGITERSAQRLRRRVRIEMTA